MAIDRTYTAMLERVHSQAVTALLDLRKRLGAAFGERPFGAQRADKWERLAHYLTLRDDPAAWSALITERAAVTGKDVAEAEAVASAVELEALLDAVGGPDVVRAHERDRMAAIVRQALGDQDRRAARPSITIRPPLPTEMYEGEAQRDDGASATTDI